MNVFDTQWTEPIPFSYSDAHNLDTIFHDPVLAQFFNEEDIYANTPASIPKVALNVLQPQTKLPPVDLSRVLKSTPAPHTYCLPLPVQRSVSASSTLSGTSTVDTDDDLRDGESYNPRRKVCAMEGCQRNVRSKGFCKSHGGGKQCMMDACFKEAQNGNYCIGHGGGKCCKVLHCSNAAQSQGLCKAHGGGARCKYNNCERSSQGGGFCRTHGGGKRCVEPGCTKGAQRGNKCAKHGGCRTCTVGECTRTDRGGGFCELHRKDKLCISHGCKRLRKSLGMCTPHVREWRSVHGDVKTEVA